MTREPMTPDKAQRYWRRTSRLMWTLLAVWALLGLGLPMIAPAFDGITLAGIPVGFLLTAQGTLIGFVAAIFWYARRQNHIDEQFHVAED